MVIGCQARPENTMFQLFLIIHIFIASTLAGIGVILALTFGLDTLTPLLVAAATGFVIAFPVSWTVAKKIVN